MPTSGITTWSLTAQQICTAAAEELGILPLGEVLEADEIGTASSGMIMRLNAMLKTWSIKANLFREATGEVEVPAGEGTGTLPQGIRDVSAVRLVLSDTNERPLAEWPRGNYLTIPNKTTEGDPTAYYLSQGIGGLTVSLWPVPTTDKVLKIDYSRSAEIITSASQTVDIVQEYQEAVYKGLAVRCANMFGAARLDAITLQKVAAEAAELERIMLDADRPNAYIFEPYDGYYY